MARAPVRFAVVGQGYFAQSAILPAFAKARNARLTALVSDSAIKLEELSKKYDVDHVLDYASYDAFLASGKVDAVYIALPNALHADFAIRAANAGVHVLCEKPMAVSEEECRRMIDACKRSSVKLMIAYRLHFEAANLAAVEIAHAGKLGELRLFSSVFTMQVRDGNVRLEDEPGSGPLYDIGVYCINAARYLFRAEPISVTSFAESNDDSRFKHVDEQMGFVLRFPEHRLATVSIGFGAAKTASYQLIGTQGALEVNPAYHFSAALKHRLTIGDETTTRTFKKRDQVAPEIAYFADCIRDHKDPEPNGYEGLADVRVIEAIQAAAKNGRSVNILPFDRGERPDATMERNVSAHEEPKLIDVRPPAE